MKIIGIAAFTQRGKALAGKLAGLLGSSFEISLYEKNLSEWCRDCFESADTILFIGACGIAVRSIAPYLKSKTTDPGVLVIDEAGQYVISLLSGHIGGANEFALYVADLLGAVPVVTTASDVNGKTAVDVFAKKNQLKIASMTDAKKIAAAILRDETIGLYCGGRIEGTIPAEFTLLQEHTLADHIVWISEKQPDMEYLKAHLKSEEATVLHLIPQNILMGVGCRRGKPYEEIRPVIEQVLEKNEISPLAVRCIASIDLKKEEAGLQALAEQFGVGFQTFPAEKLAEVPGDFKASEFVKKTTGVDNVCERSALLCGEKIQGTGKYPELISRKFAENGVTAALAALEWRIHFGK